MTVLLYTTSMMAIATIYGDVFMHPKSKIHVKNLDLLDHHVVQSCFENRICVLDSEMDWLRLGPQEAVDLKELIA